MKHLQVKAAATATDQGIFTALAATYSVDRVNDRIIPGAFEKTINAWRATEKNLPLHWDHSGSAEDVIGHVDATSMQETADGLYVEGQLDLEDSETAKEAWRSMKNNAVSLSFGYLAVKQRKAKDGVNELLEIDLFEISIVPAPANNDTKLLSLKSAPPEVEVVPAEVHVTTPPVTTVKSNAAVYLPHQPDFKSVEEVQAYLDEKFPGHQISKASQEKSDLRKRSLDIALAVATDFKEPTPVEPEPATEPEPIDSAEVRRRAERAVLNVLTP